MDRAGWSRSPAAARRHRGAAVALDRPGTAAEMVGPGRPVHVGSSVLRILAQHPVKPWQYRSWIYPRDPDFAAKATVILGSLPGVLPGQAAAAPATPCCSVDAKPSSSRPAAACRPHHRRPRAASPVRGQSTNHPDRVGAVALLAAL